MVQQRYSESLIVTGENSLMLDGDATTWDDLRVSPTTIPELGAASPSKVIIATDGNAGTGYSRKYNGTDTYSTCANYSAIETTQDLTISLWFKSYEDVHPIISKGDMWGIRRSYSSLVFNMNGEDVWINNSVITGQNTHVIVRVEYTNSNKSRVTVRVNNSELENKDVWGRNLTTDTSSIYLGYDGSEYADMDLDEVQLYNIHLTDASLDELWNSGDGTNGVPTAVDASTELIARFHFDSATDANNDCTLGTENLVSSGTHATADALIADTGTQGSLGVMALAFPSGYTTSIFFTAQLPHKYKEGTDLKPHVHWMNKDGGTGNVVWGLEFLWVNMEAAGGNTTVQKNTEAVGTQGIHHVTH